MYAMVWCHVPVLHFNTATHVYVPVVCMYVLEYVCIGSISPSVLVYVHVRVRLLAPRIYICDGFSNANTKAIPKVCLGLPQRPQAISIPRFPPALNYLTIKKKKNSNMATRST